jgi:xanthine permease
MSTEQATSTEQALRPEDERLGIGPTIGYGVQHILAMFGGVIAVPIIIGGAAGLTPAQSAVLVASGLFISGLATLLQTLGLPFFGSQLPLVQGTSFASLWTLIGIVGDDGTDGLRTVYGAVIVAAAAGLLITPFVARVVRLFPPVVTGSIITVIGLSLMPVATGWITGRETVTVGGATVPNPEFAALPSIALAGFTFLVVVVAGKIAVLSRLSVLLGLLVGTVVALVAGLSDFSGVGGASVAALPAPFAFGTPLFTVGATVSMVIVVLVIMVETTADILAVGEVVETRVDARRVGDGLRADMAASVVAPVFNSFPATAFAQNVGLVALTGIRSRFAVAAGGLLLLVLGLSPMASAVFSAIPQPVLGGAGIVLFGTVAASGIRTLAAVEYRGTNNMVIVAASVAFGLVPVVSPDFWANFPDWFATIFHSGISSAAIVAVLLNLFFNVFAPGRPSAPSVVAAGPAVLVQTGEIRILASGEVLGPESYEPVTAKPGTQVRDD